MSVVNINQGKNKVYLVGAGSGDPELLTLKAARLLQQADIVFYDALVSDDVLQLVNPKSKLIYVGKRNGCHSSEQEDIHQALANAALKHKTVIRLKGGDPFIFGRGGEEQQALTLLGISTEVVPGITAAVAAASYNNLPLTHRELSQGVTFITAHAKNGQQPNWQLYSQPNHTLVIYMGLTRIAETINGLIAAGRDISTPIALIVNASRPQQQRYLSTLGTAKELLSVKADGPGLLIIGEVCQLAMGQAMTLPTSFNQFIRSAKSDQFNSPAAVRS
ncbi:uroporphyrinogen-III C-methyltransferase [Paraferrimonas sp. SM1919]|uniref:uroporphyrinogen-III C-methyltransferase n=1 Tax=Paraferrimonas sp. SM1919 TaxID=2662263 RepID=UPI0013D0509C|nr:uroporphyrinogen-III C-methyltransferase [Paraferrimonas sp. SM1919]